MRQVRIIFLIIGFCFIGFSAKSQSSTLTELHSIKSNHSHISRVYVSKSEKYLVTLSEFKYVTFYEFGTWKKLCEYKSDKFISFYKCGFQDNDQYFYVSYGGKFQHRERIKVGNCVGITLKNTAPKDTDYDRSRVFNSKDKSMSINDLVFKKNKNILEIYTTQSKGSSSSNISKNNTINTPVVVDKTAPVITITSPNVTRGFKIVETKKRLTIKGKVTDQSGIFEVLINGEEAYFDQDGNFTKGVLLAMGENTFTVKATDIKQNTSTQTFAIQRKPSQINEVVKNEPVNDDKNEVGKYYALIIGVQDYQDEAINDLDNPISDSQKLYDVLSTKYTFNSKNITFLKNPNKSKILEVLDNYYDVITEHDNLLIFYAGHGYWEEKFEQGYWLAADASKTHRSSWLSNGTIRDYMRAIQSKHTLLITDACFGGGIFKSRNAFSNASTAVNQLYDLPSRKAMTSGTLKEVPDKSVFMEYLVKRLNQNSEEYLASEQLFSSFKTAVINNSANGQVPQFGEVKETGDEGGDFIFIKK